MNHPFVLRKRNYQWTRVHWQFPSLHEFLSRACLEMPQFGCSGSRRRFDPDAPCRPAPCASADPRRTMLSRSSAKPPSSSHLSKSTDLVKPPKPIHGNLWRGGCALLALHPESVLLFLFVGFQAWVHLQNRVLVSFKHQLPDCLVHKQFGLDKMALVRPMCFVAYLCDVTIL